MAHMDPPRTLRLGTVALSALVLPWLSGCEPGTPSSTPPDVDPVDAPFLEPGGMPHLSPAGDGAVLSWWTQVGEGEYALRAASWHPEAGFGPVRTAIQGRDFFVNWADFPSVVEVAPGKWVAHWLQRSGDGTYAYGVRVAVSEDAGATWSDPWIPHDDRSPTEHGFVTVWPDGQGGWSLVWLDGRQFADGPHGHATDEMTIRARAVAADGTPGPEVVLDHRGCDCCQTDVAMTRRGPVAVYRDRTEEEVRDIYLVRQGPDGWTEGHPVHDDGWVIWGCPVNGPAVDARDEAVAVAWFTAADEDPRVLAAFSADAGDSFGTPVRVDDGRPVGRVDVVHLPGGDALVVWLEETADGAEVRVRRVSPDGATGEAFVLARTSAARASGFPQFVPLGGGGFLAAWTEVGEDGPSAVRLARVEIPGVGQ